jgi:hypothetical protein
LPLPEKSNPAYRSFREENTAPLSKENTALEFSLAY